MMKGNIEIIFSWLIRFSTFHLTLTDTKCIYNDCSFCLTNSSVDQDFRNFVKATLEFKVISRPTSEQCLNLNFFTKHNIPKSLPLDSFSKELTSEITISPLPSFNDNITSTLFNSFKTTEHDQSKSETCLKFDIDYPTIDGIIGPVHPQSGDYLKYGQILQQVYERFNNICRQLQVN